MHPKRYIFAVIFFSFFNYKSTVYAKDMQHDDFVSLPKACLLINPQRLTFNLPLQTVKLNDLQQKEMGRILRSSLIQRCTLQIQYDSILQQIITILFDNKDVSNELLQPFYDQLLGLIKNKLDNEIHTVSSIQKILSAKEWDNLIKNYAYIIMRENSRVKDQENNFLTYETLINGNDFDDFMTSPIVYLSNCNQNISKIAMLEQIITKLSLNKDQEKSLLNIARLQNVKNCALKEDMFQYVEHILQFKQSVSSRLNTYTQLINQLITKEYLQQVHEIQSLSLMFQILTLDQKIQLKENYIIINKNN